MDKKKPTEEVPGSLQDAIFNLVDEHFPKGECKERGQAMVLVARILLLVASRDIKNKRKRANVILALLAYLTLNSYFFGTLLSDNKDPVMVGSGLIAVGLGQLFVLYILGIVWNKKDDADN